MNTKLDLSNQSDRLNSAIQQAPVDAFCRTLGKYLSFILSAPVDAYAIRAPMNPILVVHGGNSEISVDLPMAFMLFNGLLGGKVDEASPRRRPLTEIEEEVVRTSLHPVLCVRSEEKAPASQEATILVSVMDLEGRIGFRGGTFQTDPIENAERGDPVAAARLCGILHCIQVEEMAALIRTEHPQTAAVLLGQAPAPAAGEALSALPPPAQADVCSRIVWCAEAAPGALDALARILTKQHHAAGQEKMREEQKACSRGEQALHRIMAAMKEVARRNLTDAVLEFRPQAAAAIHGFGS